MLQRKALELVVPLWQQRDSHLNRKDVTMTSLIWPTAQNHKQGAHVAAATMSRLHHGPTCFFFLSPSDAERAAVSQFLSSQQAGIRGGE